MGVLGLPVTLILDRDGNEIARGHDLASLAACVQHIPWEPVAYHGSRNHFSAWLSVHGELELARKELEELEERSGG